MRHEALGYRMPGEAIHLRRARDVLALDQLPWHARFRSAIVE